MSSARFNRCRDTSTFSTSRASNRSSKTHVETTDVDVDVDDVSGVSLPLTPPPTPSGTRSRRFSYGRSGNDERRDFNVDETITTAVRQGMLTRPPAVVQPGITRSRAVRYARGGLPTRFGGSADTIVGDGHGHRIGDGGDGVRPLVDNDLVPLKRGLPPRPMFQISKEARARNRAVVARENARMMQWRRTHEPARWTYPYGRMGNFVLDDDDDDDDDGDHYGNVDDGNDDNDSNDTTAEDWVSTTTTVVGSQTSWSSSLSSSSSSTLSSW